MTIRKWLSVALIAFMTMFCINASAEQNTAPVDVRFGHQTDPISGMQYTVAYVTAVSDDVVLTGIRVNRGNCRESVGNPAVPVSIYFGQTVKYLYMKCNRIIEAELRTNHGDWVFK
ncbi:hypothetical protein RISINGSUN_79 [Erwinia phage vB_EamM_RisingSun]|uniref:Uncharacterized protein n=2 Tax=Risingsunvirus risingsun TaxID=2560435 RepID=A0A223LHU6_9CAUD|nr:hypothetical protein FDI45_gp079 [Erwinia phage vB_EamM_RisingSun]ASU03591.1 hypothetical protein RISINGSUN_79 [Erwinia phage vB_EamM_RisingSun]ASU03836.1 hypothetical protein JOAD_79 [Erwinia phage vB_EamM_Joad]